jgi:Immunity protein 52
MYDIVCKFHLPPDSTWHDAGTALEALRPYAQWLGERDPLLKRWWLGGDTIEEANRYEVFADTVNGHIAARAAVTTEFKGSREPVVFIWNGAEEDRQGASLVLSITETGSPSSIKFAPSGPVSGSIIGDYRQTAAFVALLASDTGALCCFVYNQSGYFHRMTYKDRPGVGWMLYLPRVFTPAELPEARALIPVMKDKQQMGTIIVSATDSVFDYRNPEHLKIAQAIETRLVSNDWLPTWAQMMKPAA